MHVEWGAVVSVVLLLVAFAVGFVVLAMNIGRYEWATDLLAKGIDSIRTALRRPRKPAP